MKRLVLLLVYCFICKAFSPDRPCVIAHCSWGPWSEWSNCHIRCGNYVDEDRWRIREVETPARCGGRPCEGLNIDRERCNKNGCNGHGQVLPVGCRCDDGYWGDCCEFSGPIPDPCFNNIRIDDETRSTAYQTDRSLDPAYLLCDNNFPTGSWIRFISKAGGQLATSENIPDVYTCNTHIPIYMNGGHPESGDIVSRTVCVDILDIRCAESREIKVKKCNWYYVYKLQSFTGCAKAYCAGSELRCPEGENSLTGFTPGCTSAFPRILTTPNVTVGMDTWTSDAGEIVNIPIFNCIFMVKLYANRVNVFDVEWYVDDIPVWNEVMSEDAYANDQVISRLTQFRPNVKGHQGLYTLGQNIRCSATSSFGNSQVVSPTKYSQEYYAGIRALQDVVYVEENGDPGIIQITNTVPIVCDGGYTDCRVRVGLRADIRLGFDDCTLVFDNNDDPGTVKTIRVVNRPNQQQNEEQSFVLEPDTILDTNPLYFYNHKPPHTTVHTVDKPSATCHSWGDPHLNTFDGKKYDWYGIGEYSLVETKENVGDVTNHFTIHVRLTPCTSHSRRNPSCNCGVAVREGNDVAIIDACSGVLQFYVHRDDLYCDPAFQVSVSRNGREIRVSTPTGQRVRAELFRSKFINVYVEVNGAMAENVQGLCGLYDGTPDNDLDYKDKDTGEWLSDTCGGSSRCLPKEFPKAYKLMEGSSLFNSDNWPEPNSYTPSYPKCRCMRDEDDPDRNSIINCDSIGDPMNGYGGGIPRFTCKDIRTRVAVFESKNYTDDVYIPYMSEAQMRTVSSGEPVSWPTPSGITKDMAEQKSLQLLNNSNIADYCEDIVGLLLNQTLDGVLFDIMIMDDITLAYNLVTAVESACLFEYFRNPSLWEPDDDGVLAPPAQVVKAVCPNHCSGHGECGMDGNCTCEDGYTSIDCNIEIGTPPEMKTIVSGTLCDVRIRPCERVTAAVNGLFNSDNLTCFVRDLQTNKVEKMPADFVTAYTANCHLPTTTIHKRSLPDDLTTSMFTTYAISISNDGEVESEEVQLTIYDSTCVQCLDEDNCSQKDGTCIIHGKCYSANATNPYDECSVCSPNMAKNSWTKVACSTEDTTRQYGDNRDGTNWLIPMIITSSALGAGIVVLLVIICVLLIYGKMLCKGVVLITQLQANTQKKEPDSIISQPGEICLETKATKESNV